MPFTRALRHRDRDSLPDSISSWPPPSESKKWGLRLSSTLFPAAWNVLALEAAAKRNDIDTLSVSLESLLVDETMVAFNNLVAQDRLWRIKLILRSGSLQPGMSDVLHALFSPFQSIRYLELQGGPWSQAPTLLVRELKALSSIQELNLDAMPLRPACFHSIYENETIAKITPHIVLIPSRDDTLPIQFPSTANQHLQSLRVLVYHRECVSVASQWIQQASQLEQLRSLEIRFLLRRDEDYHEPIQTLSSWIGSPTCLLTSLSLTFRRPFENGEQPLGFFSDMILPAIARNTSLQELGLEGVHAEHHQSDISNLCSAVSAKTSPMQHLVLSTTLSFSSEMLQQLLDWQISQRASTKKRFVTLHLKHRESSLLFAKIHYVSRVHERWNQWQEAQARLSKNEQVIGAGISFRSTWSPMALPPYLWPNVLEQMDETSNPMCRPVSFDAMWYLLKIWASDIAVVPSSRRKRHLRTFVCTTTKVGGEEIQQYARSHKRQKNNPTTGENGC